MEKVEEEGGTLENGWEVKVKRRPSGGLSAYAGSSCCYLDGLHVAQIQHTELFLQLPGLCQACHWPI